MTTIQMAFDLRSPPGGTPHAELVQGVLDICKWADSLEGVDSGVRLLEHHGSPDGYIPSPVTLAAAIAGATQRIAIATVILLPLYHPVRLAEELAVLDLVSKGRVAFIFGAGYRKEEFDTFGVDLAHRGHLMEEGIEVIKKAWTGEPFEYRGQTVRVMPRPYRRPPPLYMGGSSKAAARRAARIADGFLPTDRALMDVYHEELAALGRRPGPSAPTSTGALTSVVAVSADPDAAWKEVGPSCLHEMNAYAEWVRGTPVKAYWEVPDIDALREVGRYLVLTPEQCVAQAKANGNVVAINPLTGGIAPEVAWRSLRLIESDVLPHLN